MNRASFCQRGQPSFILCPGKASTRGLLLLPVPPCASLPQDVIFWVLREPGASSLDLNLSPPSTEAEICSTWKQDVAQP